MELKVWVDGIQRVVCGVSEQTTCQEVVIALAQAIGESPGAQMDPAGAPGVGPGPLAPSSPKEGGALLAGPTCPSLMAQARGMEGRRCRLTGPSPHSRPNRPLCACTASQREGTAAATPGVSSGCPGYLWTVCQRCSVCPEADRTQPGWEALLGQLPTP